MDIVGNERVRELICRSLEAGQPAPSYLFLGPEGVGKSLTALWMAQLLLCEQKEDSGPCGYCRSCRRVLNGNHPDVMLLERVEGKASIGIDEIREGIASVQTRPFEGGFRLWIISQAHRLTEEAQNSLLKTLEEPPPFLVMILATHQEGKLLATVKSRCRILRFHAPDVKETQFFLQSQGADLQQAQVASRITGGAPGRALTLLGDSEAWIQRNQAIDAACALAGADIWQALEAAAVLEGMNVHKGDPKADYGNILQVWQGFFRDAVLLATGADEQMLVNVDRLEQLQQLAGVKPESLCKVLDAIAEAQYHLERNVQAKLWLQKLCLDARLALQ